MNNPVNNFRADLQMKLFKVIAQAGPKTKQIVVLVEAWSKEEAKDRLTSAANTRHFMFNWDTFKEVPHTNPTVV